MHWKITENHTENFPLLFKYWSLHFANHTEKLLITLKKYCAVLQCNHVENHLRWLRWISVLIIGKRLNTENTLKYLWKIFRVTQFLCVGQFSWIFRVTLKFSVWFSVLKFHSVGYLAVNHTVTIMCANWIIKSEGTITRLHKWWSKWPIALTGGNWQKWKRVFLTCLCHEIYRDEAVGLKSCKNTWKITIFVKMWNLGQYRENLIICQ